MAADRTGNILGPFAQRTTALPARTATSATLPAGVANGDLVYFDGTSWAILPIGANGQQLDVVNGIPTWVSGGTATWSGTRYYAVDNVGGSDSNVGYSDTSLAAALAVAVASVSKLQSLLAGSGYGQGIVIAFKSSASTYTGTLDISALASYRRVVLRATTDGANTAAEKAICGGGVVSGTNVSGYNATATSLSATACTNATPISLAIAAHGLGTGDVVSVSGATTNLAANRQDTVTVVDANNVTLDNSKGNGATSAASVGSGGLRWLFCKQVGGAAAGWTAKAYEGKRIRFDAATATAALRGICRTIHHQGPSTIVVGADLPAAPTSSDVFYIEEVGVTLANLIVGGASQNQVSVAGIRFSTSASLTGCPTIRMSFCETSAGVVASVINNGQVTITSSYADEAGTLITTGGHRWHAHSIARAQSLTVVEMVTYGNASSSVLGAVQFAIGAGCQYIGNLALTNCGIAPTGTGAGTCTLGNQVDTTRPRLLMGAADFANGLITLTGSNANLYGIDVLNAGSSAISTAVIKPNGTGSRLQLDNIAGNWGTTTYLLDTANMRDCTVVCGVAAALGASGTLNSFKMPDASSFPYSALLLQDLIDNRGNHFIGTGGCNTEPCFAVPVAANTVAINQAVYQTGANAAEARANSQATSLNVLGYTQTDPGTAGTSVLVSRRGWLTMDTNPAIGTAAFLSAATAGNGANALPAIASPANEVVPLGYPLAVSGALGLFGPPGPRALQTTKTLTDAASVTGMDVSLNRDFDLALTATGHSIAAPTGVAAGDKVTVNVFPDATSRTLAFASGAGAFRWANSGSTQGVTQAQFDALLAAAGSGAYVTVAWKFNASANRYDACGLAGFFP